MALLTCIIHHTKANSEEEWLCMTFGPDLQNLELARRQEVDALETRLLPSRTGVCVCAGHMGGQGNAHLCVCA